MLSNKMKFKDMVDFKPNDEDMAVLDLDVVVYIKATVISIDKEINYNFVRYLFNSELKEDLYNNFKDIDKTIFYDFNYQDERAITIFELYSKVNYTQTEALLNDLLVEYSHDAEVLFDIYTHDSHSYRLSNLDGIVKNDKLN